LFAVGLLFANPLSEIRDEVPEILRNDSVFNRGWGEELQVAAATVTEGIFIEGWKFSGFQEKTCQGNWSSKRMNGM